MKSAKYSQNTRLQVLIVEDHADTRDVFRKILAEKAYAVDAVSNRDEAIALCRTDCPDVVILDYHMGGMSVEKFAREVEKLDCKPCIIYMTADATVRMLETDAILYKPFPMDTLFSEIERVSMVTA